jgi:thioredoxin reductase (NADPH)
MATPEHVKVCIIGSGPAGFTAAIYTARANLDPVLFEGGGATIEPFTLPGGQLMITTEVENYPGFPKGVQGPDLMGLFKEQAERFGTRVRTADVTAVDFSERPFRVTASDGVVTADAIIISTGASAKWIGLPSEQKFQNYGVSACATCDGALFKGRDLIVVGGGDTAMEEATFLTRFATKVSIVHRREEFRASRIMEDRARRNPKIELLTNTVIDEILGELPRPGVTGVRLRNTRDGSTWEVKTGGVFVAIGHEPNSRLFRGVLDMDPSGYLLTKPGSTATKIPGVFACGDVADHVYRQAITAAGTGCMAAIDAERFLAH